MKFVNSLRQFFNFYLMVDSIIASSSVIAAAIAVGFAGIGPGIGQGNPEELYDLEQARLALRGDLGLAVDRGRIVRESLAIIIADLESKGDQSIIARRLRGR